MTRIHLFEWEDLDWFPSVFRNNMTDFLRNMILWQKIYEPAADILREISAQTGNPQIIDLCSGAGGGMDDIEKIMNEKHEEKIKFILTDKFPNLEAINKYKHTTNITYHEKPVDASDVPLMLTGIRTIFSAFHHFRPHQARKILMDSVKKNMPIAVFEGAGKSIAEFIAFLLIFPVAIFIVTPFIRPFKWSRIIFTYLIPLLPFFIYWDGLVSILRMYTVEDLIRLCNSFNNNYKWKAGKIKGKMAVITYLTGVPEYS